MKFRILKKKLLFLHHLMTLEEGSLALEVFRVQEKLGLPGLLLECRDFLVDHNITNISAYTCIQWKNFIKNQIWEMNRTELLHRMAGYKKISQESYKIGCMESKTT